MSYTLMFRALYTPVYKNAIQPVVRSRYVLQASTITQNRLISKSIYLTSSIQLNPFSTFPPNIKLINMAEYKDEVLQYNDLNAAKFPNPVEPIHIDKFNLSAETIDMKDPIVASQIGLFTIHAVVRRSLLAVARQARSVEPSKRADFLKYAKTTFATLDGHHHHEEEIWFPIMQPYVDFTESSHEHEEIERLLEQNIEYCKIAEEHLRSGDKAPEWPGEDISSTTEKLLGFLLPHLLKEETLACLYGRRVPVEVYAEFEEKIKKAAMDEAKKFGLIFAMSFQLRHWSKKEKEIWPPVPGFVKSVFEFLGWLGYGKVLAFGPNEEELKM